MERAWLSLFRFIEFWMGLPYTEPNQVDATLMAIKEDPRLPGGSIDTEYVTEKSTRGVNEMGSPTGEMLLEEGGKSSLACPDGAKAIITEGSPHWVKEFTSAAKHPRQESRKSSDRKS